MKITFESKEYDLSKKVECMECGKKFYLPDFSAKDAKKHGIMCDDCIRQEVEDREDFYSGHGPETMGKRNIDW